MQTTLADFGIETTVDDLLQAMAQDKKVKGGKMVLVLARGIGDAFVERDVSMPELTDFLKRECATP